MVSKTIVAGSIPAAPAIQKSQKNTSWCSFFCHLKLHRINAKTHETTLFSNLDFLVFASQWGIKMSKNAVINIGNELVIYSNSRHRGSKREANGKRTYEQRKRNLNLIIQTYNF